MFDDARWRDSRDRDDDRHRDQQNQSPQLGRGPGTDDRDSKAPHDRLDPRWPDRDRHERGHDPRDVFMRNLDVPRGHEREMVRDARGREYTLRGSESRTLSTAGAFRVVPSRQLCDHDGRLADPGRSDLRHLRDQGLIETVRIPGQRDVAVTLTDRGRELLESSRSDRHEPRQEYYAGVKRERELEHDAQIYGAYLQAAERLAERGAEIERVALDYELKREYQQWLHARDRERDDYDGHPDRAEHEIEDWADAHDLPYFDDQPHFPDLRIEYRDMDGRLDHEDIEVVTRHYRGAHGAAVARSGFTRYRGSSARVGGRGGGCGRGGGHAGGLAQELWD